MHGIYEKNILYGLSKILFNQIDLRNSICLDIGANIGNHSLIFSKYFQSVYSFEPNSDIFDLLHINTKRLNNIKIFNFGASDKDESVTMQTNQKSSMGGMSVKEKESDIIPDIEVFNASMKNMDNFFRDYPVDADISFIKIDVEGFELNTLKGLRNTLNKYHPVIGFEQHQDDFFNNENIISSQSIDQIRQCGYSFFMKYAYILVG